MTHMGMIDCIMVLKRYPTFFNLLSLGPLAPRGAVGARHGALPRQFSPLLPIVCQGLRLREGFASTLRDVVSPPLFRPALLHLPSTVPCNMVFSACVSMPNFVAAVSKF